MGGLRELSELEHVAEQRDAPARDLREQIERGDRGRRARVVGVVEQRHTAGQFADGEAQRHVEPLEGVADLVERNAVDEADGGGREHVREQVCAR